MSDVPTFQDADGTRVAILRFESEGAAAIRLQFSNLSLPESARLYVYSLNAEGVVTKLHGPYERGGPALNSDFSSAPVPGSQAIVELQWSGEPMALLPFQVSAVVPMDSYVEVPDSGRIAPLEGEPGSGMYHGIPVNYQIVDGRAFAENDILLESSELITGTNAKSQDKSASFMTCSSCMWPGGVIPFVINDPRYQTWQIQRILSAIEYWNTTLAGSIKLIPRTDEQSYLNFQQGDGCYSNVGKLRSSNGQILSIGVGCETLGIIAHEIGHAVGLWHEQSRNDRDNNVSILWENISAGTENNFKITGSTGTDIAGYDFGSLMHYSPYSFSKNGLPTIETKPAGIPVGQRVGLSEKDIAAVRAMYGGTEPAPSNQSTVYFGSNPQGMYIQIDGEAVSTPTSRNWDIGSTHKISAYDGSVGAGGQYKFATWNDSGERTHDIVVGQTSKVINASYAAYYPLKIAVNPPSAGSIAVTPATPDSLYPGGATLAVTANVGAGNCFLNWTGALPGAGSTLKLNMNYALALTANFAVGAIDVTPAVVKLGPDAASAGVVVRNSGSCQWTSKSNAAWLTLSQASGSESATITLQAAANPSAAPRTATVTINGNTVTVTQSGATSICSVSSGRSHGRYCTDRR